MAESAVRIVFGIYLITTSAPSLTSVIVRALEATASVSMEMTLFERFQAESSTFSQPLLVTTQTRIITLGRKLTL